MRIVSLLPSATETLIALGLRDQLLGRTDECPDPGGVPVVCRASQPPGLDAGGIDAWVREHAGELYTVDSCALRRIQPDLVLTQDLCGVCALPGDATQEALRRVGSPATVLSLSPTRLADVLDQVPIVADAAGVPERGRRVRAELEDRLARVRAAVAGRPPVPTLVLEWLAPPFTAGHWVPDVVTAAGGVSLLGRAGQRSRRTTWSAVLDVLVDDAVVVLAPCGTPPRQTWAQEVPAALRTPRTVALDLACPSPRLVDAVEALAAHLHPGAGLPGRPDLVVTDPDRRELSGVSRTLEQ